MTMSEQMWELLPSNLRRRDTEATQGGFLRALVEVLGEQADLVEEDLAHLYDNWFIETCEPWVVPYIGDLLGVRPLHPVGTAAAMPRAYVANTIAYRRRKGTPAALEQLARDVTGWPARVVELYRLLGWTQFANHLRTEAVGTPDLRDATTLELVDGPFDRTTRTADIRAPHTGRPNIPDVALCVWRLEPFHVARATARAVTTPPDGRYTFDPSGLDVPLTNAPLPEGSITSLAGERHVPGPLRRRALYDELEGVRTASDPPDLPFFGSVPVLQVYADTGTGLQEVDPDELTSADLSDAPPDVTTGWRRPVAPVVAAVDPVLGRLAFEAGVVPSRVEVSYTYLAPGRVGAGPYDRSSSSMSDLLEQVTFSRAVGRNLPGRPALARTEVTAAVADWGTPAADTVGLIAVLDDRTYAGPLAITVPAGTTLLLVGGSWPDAEQPPVVDETIDPRRVSLDERRPVVTGGIVVTGGPAVEVDGVTPPRGRLLVDGLVVEGGLTIADGDLGELVLTHTTLVPDAAGGLTVEAGNTDLTVIVDRCITGPLSVPEEGPVLDVRTSIVDGVGGPALDTAECVVTLDAVTVLGALSVRALTASDSVLDGSVTVARTQEGCVRYSAVDDTARTPRRYRCQPDLTLRDTTDSAASVRARLTPQLQSRRFGDPGYGQLSDRCADELLTGSSLHSDMGAFAHLVRPQREANLRTALDEYLRVGLTASVLHVT